MMMKDQKVSNRPEVRVRFSEMSSMICYSSTDNEKDLHYSSSDYSRFKRDALQTAQRIQASINARQVNMKVLNTKSPMKRYIESWQMLPQLLKECQIEPDEAIGIEHLLIGKEMVSFHLAFRGSYRELLLEEQYYQQEKLGHCDPELLAHVVKPFTEISLLAARQRAGDDQDRS